MGFLGTAFCWVFWQGFKVWVASAKCYSQQVNLEMENDYCVFIVKLLIMFIAYVQEQC